jgi:hypothetical protein
VFGAGTPKTNIKVGTAVTNCPNPQTAFRVQPLSTDEQTTIVIGTLTQTQTLTRSASTKGRKKMAPPITAMCGTRSAYVRHKRKGETPCDSCRLAYNAYWRDWYSSHQSSQSLAAQPINQPATVPNDPF